jgi:uncharacterized protein
MSEPESLIQYPTDFPIKIMGMNELGFEVVIAELIREHAPDFDMATIEVRESSGGKYLSITATVNAKSREQLDSIYRALTSHPKVRVVL